MWAWDWLRWEREIDWMALQGVNIALAYTGQVRKGINLQRETPGTKPTTNIFVHSN